MTGIEPFLVPIGVWAWESYGKDAIGWIVKRLAKGVEDVKTAGWDRVDWALASRTYRQEMDRLYGSMQIFGMNRPVPLTSIFTDVYLLDKPSAWRRHSIDELCARAQTQPDQMSTEKRYSGVDLVQSESRLFILGHPGAGKTTFLKYLVTQAITGKLDAIPVFVSLKTWSNANIDLLPFLVRQFAICGFPDAQLFVERILEEGKALVLFDGLDEVNLEADARQHITTAICEYAQKYGKSRIVITCRTAATEYVFERFSYCELADFTQAQIEAFVTRWFHADPAKHEAFLKAFAHEDNKGLRDLARLPLLLTMVCLTFEETMAFPRRRAELYEEATDALLKKWDSARSIQRDIIYRKLSLGYKRQLLVELAAETFERGEFFMVKHNVVEHTTRFLRRLPPVDITEDIDGEAVLRSIEAQHGLLVERARNIYSFSHLTFHEYFAARYIAEHPEESVLRGTIVRGADSQWREVLLLTASMLDYRNIALLFRVWHQDLQAKVQCDAGLRSLIVWSVETSHAIAPSSSSVRVTVLMIALVDQMNISTNQLILDLDRAYDSALDRIRAYDSAHDRARVSAYAYASAYARTQVHNLARDLNLVRTQIHNLARDLNLVRTQIHNLTRTQVHNLVSNLDLVRTQVHDLARDLDLIHSQVRDLDVTRDLDLARAITRDLTGDLDVTRELNLALDCIFTLTQVHDLCARDHTFSDVQGAGIPECSKNWQLTRVQLERLKEYVSSTYRLLECLEVATVENRMSVLDQLLILPPNQKAVA